MFRFLILLLICIVYIRPTFAEQDISEPVVSLDSGKVRGFIYSSTNGINRYGFLGIPYAKPPVNSLRFKPPETVEPWSEILDCTKVGKHCPQVAMIGDYPPGNEDCLIIDVYTPQLENSVDNRLPVMVWIHGGGFVVGSGHLSTEDSDRPNHLMNSQVVLVSLNYRLGVLGFLSTEDENSFGNYGMLDQVMALKWVQDNIDRFGGDPSRVTIFGVSAGSASVVHHMLSPLSKGLFHKAIAQSGTSTNHWAIHRNPLRSAQMLAEQLKCPEVKNTKAIVECLSQIPAQQLVDEARKLSPSTLFPLHFAPSIEPANGPVFLTEDPLVLMKEGRISSKVPVIIGMTMDEGYSIHFDLTNTFKFEGRKYYENLLPTHLPLFSQIQPNMTFAIREIARNYYDGLDLDDEETFHLVLAKMTGDTMFNVGISQTIESFSKAGLPTYAYILNHQTDNCLAVLFGGKCGGFSTHGDDMILQFAMPGMKPLNADDLKVANTWNTLWTSFASDSDMYINDHEKWPSYDVTNRHYVEISLTPTIKSGPLSDKMALWMETLPNLMHKQNVKLEL